MLRTSVLPILAIVLAAVGLALMLAPGVAAPTTSASYKYYVPGYASVTQEAVDVSVTAPKPIILDVTGDQRSTIASLRTVDVKVCTDYDSTNKKCNKEITIKAVDDRAALTGYFYITRSDKQKVQAVQLRICINNAKLLRKYLEYLYVYIYYLGGKKYDYVKLSSNYGPAIVAVNMTTKAVLSLYKPCEVITLTSSEFAEDIDVELNNEGFTTDVSNGKNDKTVMLRVAVAYEIKEKKLFDQLPLDLKIDILNIS